MSDDEVEPYKSVFGGEDSGGETAGMASLAVSPGSRRDQLTSTPKAKKGKKRKKDIPGTTESPGLDPFLQQILDHINSRMEAMEERITQHVFDGFSTLNERLLAIEDVMKPHIARFSAVEKRLNAMESGEVRPTIQEWTQPVALGTAPHVEGTSMTKPGWI